MLAKAVFPDKKYVTFDDRPLRELASSNPRNFLMASKDGAIIDEAQKVPGIFDALKMKVDGKPMEPGEVYPSCRITTCPSAGSP